MPDQENHEPIRQSVHVDCPIEDAFQLFTERMPEWWPSSEERDWGTVTEWDPPRRVGFAWRGGTIDVEFTVEADGTRVTLTHTGWEFANTSTCVMLAGVANNFARFAAREMMVAV